MARALLFTGDPGGAEVLAPVARLLARRGFETAVLARGHARERFRRHGVASFLAGRIPRDCGGIFLRHAPDVVITSASGLPWVDMSEKHLWEEARARRVPSIAFLDQWQNYAERFSGTGEAEKLRYLPDLVNCIDGIGKEEMIGEGFDARRLRPLGHPYLSSLRPAVPAPPPGAPFAEAGGGGGAPPSRILFVSEPIAENYGEARGYDQFAAIERVLDSIDGRSPGCELRIRLHPKDDPAKFRRFERRRRGGRVVVATPDGPARRDIEAADVVLGMTSIALIEAYILGKRVLSVQPGLKVRDPLMITRRGLAPLVTDAGGGDILREARCGRQPLEVAFREEAFLDLVAGTLREEAR